MLLYLQTALLQRTGAELPVLFLQEGAATLKL